MHTIQKRATLAVVFAGFIYCGTASAQQQEEMDPQIMEDMMRSMFSTMIEVTISPDVAKMYAVYIRTLYSELIDQGFSEEEAYKLCLSHAPLSINSE